MQKKWSLLSTAMDTKGAPVSKYGPQRLKYECNRAVLDRDAVTRGRFLDLTPADHDDEAKEFLDFCQRDHNSPCGYFIHCAIRPTLALILPHTQLHGFLGTGKMHLLSADQLRRALEKSDSSSKKSVWSKEGKRLLDVGAGDGGITERLAGMFDHVETTEVSSHMAFRLRKKGWICHHTADVKTVPRGEGFDVICLLNVLDRCDRPLTLLRDLRKLLRNQDSQLLLAVPLPLRPAVEHGHNWVKPKESVCSREICSDCVKSAWEESVTQLMHDVFLPCGFRLRSVSRVPYLSQGDARLPWYVLDDGLFVLEPSSDAPSSVYPLHKSTWSLADGIADGADAGVARRGAYGAGLHSDPSFSARDYEPYAL
eukprot:g82576.t1